MKIKLLFPVVILLLIAGAYFYPVKKETGITIHTSLLNVYTQLGSSANWKNWNHSPKMSAEKNAVQSDDKTGFNIGTADDLTRVKFLNSFLFGISKGKENYEIGLIPRKYDKTTLVVLNYQSNLLYQLMPGESQRWLKKTGLLDLKNYLEDPLSFSGVAFKKITLTNMDMMVYDTVVNAEDRFTEMAKLAKKMRAMIPVNEIAEKDKVYIKLLPVNQKFNIVMGIHVKRELPQTKKPVYLKIPNTTAFVVNYTGKYNNKQNIYHDMETYLNIHEMKKTIDPIEEYSSDNLPANDTGRIKTQIIFPVY